MYSYCDGTTLTANDDGGSDDDDDDDSDKIYHNKIS